MAQQQDPNSRLIVHDIGGIKTVDFVDKNILEEANIQKIGDELTQIVERESNPRLLVNFENVEHLSSAALGTLITVNNKIKQKGGQLRLASIDPQIYEVFVITKLNKLFHIHDSYDSALGSFK